MVGRVPSTVHPSTAIPRPRVPTPGTTTLIPVADYCKFRVSTYSSGSLTPYTHIDLPETLKEEDEKSRVGGTDRPDGPWTSSKRHPCQTGPTSSGGGKDSSRLGPVPQRPDRPDPVPCLPLGRKPEVKERTVPPETSLEPR